MSGFTEYYVPAGFGEAEFTEKKSKFIGRVWRVKSDEEAQAKINEMREKHRDATHNVYAYIIRSGALMRYSDDGEPQGTSVCLFSACSGMRAFMMFAVWLPVLRGTLLGTGGLVRAYSHTASLALEGRNQHRKKMP